jgi:hypothetical protein
MDETAKHNVTSLNQQNKLFFFSHKSYFFFILFSSFSFFFFCYSITGSPKTARKSVTTGIGHHINPLHNPYPNRETQPTQPTGAMPQYGGGSDKCARCLKTVYIAEKKVGAGRVCISTHH